MHELVEAPPERLLFRVAEQGAGGGIYGKDAEGGKGFIQTLSLDTGAKIAERRFDAPLTYNGVTVAGGMIYATLADGAAVCIGGK